MSLADTPLWLQDLVLMPIAPERRPIRLNPPAMPGGAFQARR